MNSSTEVTNNRILVIDDNPSIHDDIRKILGGGKQPDAALAQSKALLFEETPAEISRTEFQIDSAFQGEEGLRKVQQAAAENNHYALAFVDVRMPPGWDGVETITQIWKSNPDLQVVICTAYSDFSWEEIMGQLGKSDSMLILKKPFDNVEVLQLAHALTRKWILNRQLQTRLSDLDQLVNQRTLELETTNEKLKKENIDRMQVEKALRLSEERFSKAFKASPLPLAIQSLHQEKYVDANAGFQELTGFSREEIIGQRPHELNLWGDPERSKAMLQMLREQTSIRNLSCRLQTKSGQQRDILLSVELFELDGEPFLLTIAQDITEQIKLEHQLRQSQKMDAIGQLAAGVAHDFNNILTVIQGHASLLLASRAAESNDRKPLQTISLAADRASKLVRQLLTFSRKQVMQVRPMEIRGILTSVAQMLPRLLGEHITINVLAPASLPNITADAGMIEQMLINLAVNARDAMPTGGTLLIRTETVEVTAELARQNTEARPGQFLCLSVSDTGCGIPAEILPRIFEPFFTTKAVGKGTGLGLATVYGIAKQHQGWVEVQSQVGRGSTFRIFVPISETQTAVLPAAVTPEDVKGGHETILVAEDEEDVRDFVVQVLEGHGYTVLSAACGLEALQQWSQRKDDIALLVTDMVMPGGLMGRELAECLLEENPRLAVLYTSGYTPGMAGRDLKMMEERNFLAKPYGPAKLLQVVRDCLDHQPQPRVPQEPALV